MTKIIYIFLFFISADSFASDNRSILPLYKEIPALKTSDLTLSIENFNEESFKKWHRSNANSNSIRYSSLNEINKNNINQLDIAFIYKSNTKPINIQANPIVVNTRAFFPIGDDYIVCIDATNGKEIWRSKTAERPAPRGLLYWEGDPKNNIEPRIFFPAGNNLFAISAHNGKLVKSFGDKGAAGDGRSMVSPAIVNNTLIYATISNQPETPPSVQGIDINSGKTLWKTNLRKRWDKGSGDFKLDLGGANPWGGISVDTLRGIAFITTGDPHPVGVGINRPGNNEFSNSIVAININDGKILWSFQEVAHDLWDLDIAAPPILSSIIRNNKKYDVVIATTKIGNTIILDRVKGKPIYPFRLKKAPASKIPGEVTSVYQPDLVIPEPFSKNEFTYKDITNIGKENADFVKKIVDKSNIGFFPPPDNQKESIYFNVSGGSEWPGASVDPFKNIIYIASSQTASMISLLNLDLLDTLETMQLPGRKSYEKYCQSCHGKFREGGSAETHLISQGTSILTRAYIIHTINNGKRRMPSLSSIPDGEKEDIAKYLESANTILTAKINEKTYTTTSSKYIFGGWKKLLDQEGYPGNKPPWGYLTALNLNNGKIIFKVPLGEDMKLHDRGLKNIGTQNLGAPVATLGGLIFVAGTPDEQFRAFDASTGKELWKFKLPAYGSGAPTIYEVNKKQYILLPATGGNGTIKGKTSDTFVAFTLKGVH
jgi:quinoprotein glucose dehydrogenase